MIKQQQQPSTTSDLSIISTICPLVQPCSSSSTSMRQSSSFKQRINQLKAKVKPSLASLPKQTEIASPKVQSDAKFRNCIFEMPSTDRVLNIEQIVSLGKVDDRMLSQRKVIGMKVCYRKQALFTKKQPVLQSNRQSEKFLQSLNNANGKLTLNKTVEEKECNKQNKSSNYFQIQDILINNCKARSPMPTQRMSQDLQLKEFRKLNVSRSPIVTNIDIRECSARSAADYSYKAGKKSTKGNKDKDKARTTRHIKTLSTTYRIK